MLRKEGHNDRIRSRLGDTLGTGRGSDLVAYRNTSIQKAPGPVLAEVSEREFGKAKVTKCWLNLDEMWDYQTRQYGPAWPNVYTDVFDPSFKATLIKEVAQHKGKAVGDPWCLGYFLGNEHLVSNTQERQIVSTNPLVKKHGRKVALVFVAVCWADWSAAAETQPADTKAELSPLFVSPNEFEGTDVERINQAIEAAAEAGCRVVVPRVNLRAGQRHDIWLLDSAILLRSDTTLDLDNCHIKLSDRCRDNFIRSANCGLDIAEIETMRNVQIRGIGRVLFEGADHPRATGDTHRIIINNVTSKSSHTVLVGGSLSNSILSNIIRYGSKGDVVTIASGPDYVRDVTIANVHVMGD